MEQEIREFFGQEIDLELSMKVEEYSFTLVHITPEDEENIRRFRPYCDGDIVGKYGLVWSASWLVDYYVFDTREYAVDFIVWSCPVNTAKHS